MQVPSSIRQLALLIKETVDWRFLFLNWITIVVVSVIAASLVGAAYVDETSNGTIEGTVVDENGEPVSGVEVTLRRIEVASVNKVDETTTNENGRFRFEDHKNILELEIVVTTESGEVTKHKHLYYRGQDTEITVQI